MFDSEITIVYSDGFINLLFDGKLIAKQREPITLNNILDYANGEQ